MQTHKDSYTLNRRGHLPAVSWKNAFLAVFGAASRLHHYRDVHTRMMREATCVIDCGGNQDGCENE